MNYEIVMGRIGLSSEEVLQIEEKYHEYEMMSNSQLEKIIAALKSKRDSLISMFTIPIILVIATIATSSLKPFFIIDTNYSVLIGLLFMLYLVTSIYYILNQLNEYADKAKELSLHIEICSLILARRIITNTDSLNK